MIKEVLKEWGKEIWLANTDKYSGKKLILQKGKRCSKHHHINKDETFYVESGRCLMERGNDKKIMEKDDSIRIKPNTIHRFSGLEDTIIIEISTHHEDDDSYRIEGEESGDVPIEIIKEYIK